MKGLNPIRTVGDLKRYLDTCPDNAEICIMPEDGEGDGLQIGGILEFANQKGPPEVWILIDEFGDTEEASSVMEWSGSPPDDDEDLAWEAYGKTSSAPRVVEEVKDVVQVRGKLRSA